MSGRRAGWAATAAAIGTLAWSGPGFAAGATVAFHRSGVDGATFVHGTQGLEFEALVRRGAISPLSSIS